MIQNMLESAILYTLELLKILLTCIFILKIQIKHKKTVSVALLLSILLIFMSSKYINVTYDFPTGILYLLLIFIFMSDKQSFGLVCLAYIFICIIDMALGSIVMFSLNLNIDSAAKNFPLMLLMNSVSLLLLIIPVSIIFRKRNNPLFHYFSRKNILLLIVGGLTLGIYLTATHFLGFTEGSNILKDITTLSISILSIVFLIIVFLSLSKQNQLEHLKREYELSQKALQMQQDYYTALLDKETETKSFRHDIRSHIYCMNSLYHNKKYNELGDYLSQLDTSLQELKPKLQTGNALVNAIVSDICRKHSDVRLDWHGLLPGALQITFMDLCTIFSNLLCNAFEAAETMQDKTVTVSVKILESSLLLIITNPSTSSPPTRKGRYLSTKEGYCHGFGIQNVAGCVEKNGGFFEILFENGLFTAKVTFLDAIAIAAC